MLLQVISPRFPVVVKIGHAYSGNGTVRSTVDLRCSSE